MTDLVLLHGALGSKDQLTPLENALKEYYNIFCFNFPGHGGQPVEPYDFSIAGFAAALKNFVAGHNISNPSVFGYSMGGFVALFAAAEKMIRFNKIITLATKFDWSPAVAAKEAAMLDPEAMKTKVPAFVNILSERHAPQDWKEHLRLTSQLMQDLGNSNPLHAAALSQIHQPCLLMLGDHDKMVSQQETEAVQKQLPAATFHLLADTAHPIEKVNTQLLAGAIHDFLRQ